jgi:hypothetical protein
MMRTTLWFILLCLFAGCAQYAADDLPKSNLSITPDRALEVANSELIKRQIPVSKQTRFKVEQSFADEEGVGRHRIFVVSIYKGESYRPRYQVHIDARTGDIEDFTDSRMFMRFTP